MTNLLTNLQNVCYNAIYLTVIKHGHVIKWLQMDVQKLRSSDFNFVQFTLTFRSPVLIQRIFSNIRRF